MRRDITHAREWGVTPSQYWGGETPGWTPEDRAIIDALDAYEATCCPGCGRPLSEHEGTTAADYTGVAITCPSLEALDRDQAEQARRDGNRDATANPERSRRWVHGTRSEMTELAQMLNDAAQGGTHG
ncbi:hypothetical protein FYJ43_04360 [Cutibacterium sp. WCA-380-WT-3A]|uniref:Uncharacterized protein n=1 Tax=Cutibacterium porci TaxID=2605781 RepID=A0A7K0J5R6_9ACTN|nr:hypothetical protein [Cutibacterium porci]MSS45290.1 hypothetical protein [Cutibacterium porci]